MLLNDITKMFGVHAINLRTQNRTLWDSEAKLLISGYSVFNNYTLYPTDEIRPEPTKCIASYTVNITQSGEQDIVIYCGEEAEISNISKIADEPASNADKMSFCTLIKAVSVECVSLHADCSGSNILYLIKCSLSYPDTTLSMTFEVNVKLDTGR